MAAEGLVVDASAILKAVLVEDGFSPFEGRSLHAPTLLWSETLSGISQLAWRTEISAEEADAAVERLSVAPLTRHDSADLLRDALEIARALGWAKTYDAEYVALARKLGLPLFSVDARLMRGIAGVAGVRRPYAGAARGLYEDVGADLDVERHSWE